jgi:hypothetical protein
VAEAQKPEEPFVPGAADEQSPETDEAFAASVDAVADAMAEAFVEDIETDPSKS